LGSEQCWCSGNYTAEGELMLQEQADITVDTLARDDEDNKEISELENVVDLSFDVGEDFASWPTDYLYFLALHFGLLN